MISSIASTLGILYTDRIDIYRFTHGTEADGTTSTSLPSTPTYANIPCRISFTTESAKDKDIGNVPINVQYQIFVMPSVDIQAGDEVVIYRKDRGATMQTYRGIAGLPSVYPSHKQFAISIEESA